MARVKPADKLSNEQISTILVDYFNEQMKPYAINDILNNLNLVSYKKQVVSALEQLTIDGKLVVKQFGKSSIWIFAYIKEKSNENEKVINEAGIKKELCSINEQITKLTSKKKSLLMKKQMFSQFIEDPEELQRALASTQSRIKTKLSMKKEISKRFDEINNSKVNQDVDTAKINKQMSKIKKRAKSLLVLERTLADMVLLCVPSIKKKNLKDFLVDEIGCEQITMKP